jgi:hypothetical protein
MTTRIRALAVALVLIALGVSAAAQVGHPAKGSWSGYWGTSAVDKHRLVLLLDWRDRAIVGVVNPGPSQVPIDTASLDVETWTLTLHATLPGLDGSARPFVATGQLSNLGSWVNRTYSGTYQYGTERGRFTVTLN